jgi:hypothetical protein
MVSSFLAVERAGEDKSQNFLAGNGVGRISGRGGHGEFFISEEIYTKKGDESRNGMAASMILFRPIGNRPRRLRACP